ncbi:MAG TPA: hypothetical protein VGE45_09820 [Chloroflexia bacterium]|jgi:hypothetical protein
MNESSGDSFPSDLAEIVYSRLAQQSVNSPYLTKQVLTRIFQTMYFASLKTEESQSIRFHITYLDPDNPDPNPPKVYSVDRWSAIKIQPPIDWSISGLSKVAEATDPRTSSLAVYSNANYDLFVWGVIDQGNSYHDYITHETERPLRRPGLFTASIVGVGHLAVWIDSNRIAELRINRIFTDPLEVITNGPINALLRPGIDRYIDKVRPQVPLDKTYYIQDSWLLAVNLAIYWLGSLRRILLRVQNYGHGGALLITPDTLFNGLDKKYSINYPRLRIALETVALAHLNYLYAFDRISDQSSQGQLMPIGLHNEQTHAMHMITSGTQELQNTIWFISLLTRVDGLVLMDPDLEVKGFGVFINSRNNPPAIFEAVDAEATESQLRPISLQQFGTRHQSMIRYCSEVPRSIGFVVSQDGDVRAIAKVYGRLVVWSNIDLQRNRFLPQMYMDYRDPLS